MLKRKTFSFLLSLLLASTSAGASGPRKLYDGPVLSSDSVITLLPPRQELHAFMVLKVSGKTAGGSCLLNCMFIAPVQIAPGKHEFASANMNIQPFNDSDRKPPALPPSLDDVFELKSVSKSMLANSFTFTFDQELVKGKTYRLEIGQNSKGNGVIWWQLQ